MSSISQKNIVEESFELLIKCMMQSKHRLMELGSDMGLPGMQAAMVLMLDKPKPMNSFTKIFNCDASNITGIVDGLEEKGIAARFPSTTDRRIKMVELCENGEELRTQLLNALIDEHKSVLFKLSTNEVKELNRLLGKLVVQN
jgi:DNA-binding MarR family transcriptional regulator